MPKEKKVAYQEWGVVIRVPESQADSDRASAHTDLIEERLATFLTSQMLPGWEFAIEDRF